MLILVDLFFAGSQAVGTRLLLQYIATTYPKIVVEAIPKCLNLQNSYKNRKPIWLSILWAMGQAGFRDLSVGLKGEVQFRSQGEALILVVFPWEYVFFKFN